MNNEVSSSEIFGRDLSIRHSTRLVSEVKCLQVAFLERESISVLFYPEASCLHWSVLSYSYKCVSNVHFQIDFRPAILP